MIGNVDKTAGRTPRVTIISVAAEQAFVCFIPEQILFGFRMATMGLVLSFEDEDRLCCEPRAFPA